MAFGAIAGGEFADGGGFARTVDADHQHHARGGGRHGDGTLGGFEDGKQMLANEELDFGGIAHELAVNALADVLQNFGGGADANIGGDQGILELVKQIAVDLLAALKGIFDFVDETGARFRDSGFQTVKETGHEG